MPSGLAVAWTWDWVPFNTSASFGDNPFFDWVRVVCLVVGVVLLFSIGRVLVESYRRAEPMPPTQKARFLSLALSMVYICFTEFAVFGTPATPRLLVGLLALAAGVYGVHGQRVKQRRTPTV